MEFIMAYPAKRNPNRPPTHPGALLREDIIPAVGRSKSEIAKLLGISRQHLHAILAEKKPVTPEVAVLLGTLFCDGPEIWVRMQGVMTFGTLSAALMSVTSALSRGLPDPCYFTS
jgi:addiction module HigA family antidote